MEEICKSIGFVAQNCTPEHPQANGLAEKMMSSIVKLVHASLAEKKKPKEEIYRFLLNYRNTPHSSTGFTPSRLLMGRVIKTKLPALIPKPKTKEHRRAQENNKEAKRKAKEYADKRRRAKDREVKVGDKILIAQDKSTIRQPFDPNPYEVTKVSHAQVTAEGNGRKKVRNMGKCKIVKERPNYLKDKECKEIRRQIYESDSELSDFDLIPDEIEAPRAQAIQPIVRDRNQIEEAQDRVAEERQAQEDLLGGDDANGSSEDEVELAVERPRRKRKRPDR